MDETVISGAETGLSSSEAARRLERHGRNELVEVHRISPARVLLRQFSNFLVLILIVAGAVALVLGELIDAFAIALVVALNGILGFVQEWRAETALDALRSMLTPTARVLRDGRERTIPAAELVPGDLVVLDTGQRVPADIELRQAVEIQVDESVLTGESVPVEKSCKPESNRLLMGTVLVTGHGRGSVTATGGQTEFGKIAELTGTAGEKPTVLQRQLGLLARQLGLAAVLIAALVAAIGVWTGRDLLEMGMTGLSLAVAIVPEGLPAVVTVTLALGASAMVRRRALVRRLQAVETLGAASVICTDKTGTLTENKMTAVRIWTPEEDYEVTGTGYDPAGHIAAGGEKRRAAGDGALGRLLQTALLCNNAQLSQEGPDWQMSGAPTEAALVTLAYKGWAPVPRSDDVLAEVPFTSERKRMSVVAQDGAGYTLHVKGAPERILEVCTRTESGADLTEARRGEILAAYHMMAREGLRVIALAMRPAAGAGDTDESGLAFQGLVGLIDPPRPEVREAIRGCRSAGIRVIMITGDSPVTARAIADELGLALDEVMTVDELRALPDAELERRLRRPVLFARTAPADKMRIVRALQAGGEIVAMTGDGVNDAPALKQADIGVAMGQRGTDVARDASDLVLLDDNFATIVGAVAEGRRQFENVRKFVRYLLSSNAGEVMAVFANILLGGPLIFLASQILWMNLVTDGVTAVALGLERAEAGQMKSPPRRHETPVVGRAGLAMIVALGLYTALASLWIFHIFLPQGGTVARTAAFTGMIFFEQAAVFAFRSFRSGCTTIGWFSNRFLIAALLASTAVQLAAVYWPPLQLLLRTEALGWAHWAWIAVLCLPLIVVPEIIKTHLWGDLAIDGRREPRED